MTESALRTRLCREFRALGLDPQPVEDKLRSGVPDLNLAYGIWVELKTLPGWPMRDATPVRLPHEARIRLQCQWLRRRWRRDRGAWLLLTVGQEHLLFTGEDAHRNWVQNPHPLSKTHLTALAFRYWPGQPSGSELAGVMLRERNNKS